jgi:protein involved in polysaccharide export with SLBB domain
MNRLVFMLVAAATLAALVPPAGAQVLTPPSAPDSLRVLAVRPGDVVRIVVWGHTDLSGEFPVDENFDLFYPIVGAINVRQMTVVQLRERLNHELEQLFQRPFVVVTPLFRVAVLGEVFRPSLYSVDATMTVFDVIAEAGGPTRDANQRRIQLVRGGETIPVALDATAIGRATLRELGIRSGDHIVLPRKRITMTELSLGLQIATLVLTLYTVVRK